MRVEELMTKAFQSCRPEDSLEHAAQLMWEHDCGSIPVCAPSGDALERAIGMITDRDICMNALFRSKPLRELTVGDAMSKEVRACRPGDSLFQAEKIMRDARVRRLPVLNEQGAPVGVLSLGDLAREAARERPGARHEITEAEVGDTLAAISEPAAQPLAA